MNRFPRSVARGKAARLIGGSALSFALALPLIAWSAGLIAVQSVSLSPTDVINGQTTTGTVRLDAPATGKITSVALSSSNTSLVTVPTSVGFGLGAQARNFTAQTVSGAFGCTRISARLGLTQARFTDIAVLPTATNAGAPVHLTLNSSAVVGGTTTTGRVTVFGPVGTVTVQLNSNNPMATVPASVNVTMNQTETGNIGASNFTIQTSSTGSLVCPIITATIGANSSRRLLKVVGISG